MKTIYFIDYENIPLQNFRKLKPDERLILCLGKNNTKIPIDLMLALDRNQGKWEIRRINQCGKNYLDMIIAFEVGRFSLMGYEKCVIISKDKGYDSLIDILSHKGIQLERKEKV